MSKNFMQSTAELCFADRDFLPSYCRTPERRTSYRSNPDTDEAQRYFGAENDFEYLISAETRQDEDFDFDSDDDLFDEAEEGLEEHLVGAWAKLDVDESDEDKPLHPVREVMVKEWNQRCRRFFTITKFIPARPPQEPVDPEDAEVRRHSRVEARELSDRFMDRGMRRGRNQGRQPHRIHDSRETIRRG